MTATAPRFERLGEIAFVQNNFGDALSTSGKGGLETRSYEYFLLDLNGILTISGGTVDGVPVLENPRTLIDKVVVELSGSPIGDTFIDIPLTDLVVLNQIMFRNINTDPVESPVNSGANGAYTFRGRYLLPFFLYDMSNPYKGLLALGRYTQCRFRIHFTNGEHLVAGGTGATKAITSCSVTVYGQDYTGDGRLDVQSNLVLHQRIVDQTIGYNATAQSNQKALLSRTGAMLRGLLIRQYSTDSNGVETPIEGANGVGLIRDTDPLKFILNTNEPKYDTTWEQLKYMNRQNYKRELSRGYVFFDMSPMGDEELVRQMLMSGYGQMKAQWDNGSITNGNLRFTVVKYAFT